MVKKKLLVITGAGSSIEFGMPKTIEIDQLMENWAREVAPLRDDPTKSLYTWVREKTRDYASQNPNNRLDYILNFENLLFTIQTLSGILTDKDWKHNNNRLNPFIHLNDFPAITVHGSERPANGDDFHFLHSYLTDNLLAFFRTKSKTVTSDKKDEFKQLQRFFNSLKREFQLSVVNLNYDNIILTVLPKLETGFDKSHGAFHRSRIYESGFNLCLHLHGSIHFDMKGGNQVEMHKIFWEGNLNGTFSSNSSGRNSNSTSEGLGHLNSSIIAGLDKTNQILREPFNTYYMQLDKLIYEADSILFLGYGFNDIHLNSTFPFIRYDKSKTRKVVIVDYADDKEDGLNFRHDGWSYGVSRTIPFNGSEMGDGKSRVPHAVGYYKKKNALEKSMNSEYPLAVYYGGLLNACSNIKNIKKELQ